MCYLVTGVSPGINIRQASRIHAIFDTEEEAKAEAEKLVRSGCNEVSVWKQIATPKISQTVTWETKDGR